ncbi:MAG: transglutaminase-like domain-containing protein [Candidatus Micrarchaeia archaeon]
MKRLCFLLSVLACSAALDVREIGELQAEVSTQWFIEAVGEPFPYPVTLYGLAPANDANQRAGVHATTHPFSWRSGDGARMVFEIEVPNRTTVAVSSSVRVDYEGNSITSPVRYPYPVPPELANYTRASPLVVITPEIRSTALEIANGSDDALEVIARLVEWTYNNVGYDRELGELNYSSEWVFTHRRGTCDEFAHLFIALARALGLPARFVSGYINTGEEWGIHGWAEVWVPEYGWIPADPTFNELLVLDAAHIRLAEALDQSYVKDTLQARGEIGVQLGLNKNYSITIREVRPFSPRVSLSLTLPEGDGRSQLVRVRVTNLQNGFVFAPLMLIPPRGVSAEGKGKLAYLKPLESKEIVWNLWLPELELNNFYTFPVTVKTHGTSTNSSFHRVIYAQRASSQPEVYGLGTSENIPMTFKLFLMVILVVTIVAVILALWETKGGSVPPSSLTFPRQRGEVSPLRP